MIIYLKTMRSLLFLLAGLVLWTTATGQDITVDTLLANTYVDTANTWYDSSKYELSTSYYEKAAVLYEKHEVWVKMLDCWNRMSGNYLRVHDLDKAFDLAQITLATSQEKLGEQTKQEAVAYNNIGSIYYMTGQYEQALEYYQKALAIRLAIFGENHPFVARAYNNIGVIYKNQEKHKQALEYYRKSLTIQLTIYGEHHSDVAMSYQNIGSIYDAQGTYEQTLQYEKKSLAIRLAIFGENHPDVATSYHNIGLTYHKQGKYEQALEYHQKSLAIRLSIFEENHPSVARSYSNIGSMYDSQGKYEQALEYYQKALAIQLSIFEENHPSVASSYNNIGVTYNTQGKYEQALEYHQKALAIKLAIFEENHPNVAGSYNNIGLIYDNQGKYEQALEHHQKALAMRLATFGENHPSVASSYHNLGDIYFAQGQYEQALQSYQKALIANGAKQLVLSHHLPRLDSILNFENLLGSLKEKAATLYQQYLETQATTSLQNAQLYATLADQLIDSLRQYYQSPEDKLSFNQLAYYIYTTPLQICHTTYNDLQNSSYIDTAFYYMEKSKANGLLSALSESRALNFANLPDSLVQQEADLKSTIAFYRQKVHELQLKEDTTQVALLRDYQNILFEHNQQYRKLRQTLESNYPDYYTLKYNTRVIKLAETQQKFLDDQSALIQYALGDSTLFAIVLTKKNKQFYKLNYSTTLQTQIEQFLVALSQQPGLGTIPENLARQYTEPAYALYQSLIEPIHQALPQHINRLIIIPDGQLNYIPFEALLTQAAENNPSAFNEHHYLLADYTISYAYSATLLQEMHEKSFKAPPKEQVLAFAPLFPEGAPVDVLASLRSSFGFLRNKKEVDNISEIYAGKYLIHPEATKAAFQQLAPQYAYLHIATHAQANDQFPNYSLLGFSSATDPRHYYDSINVADIYNIPLNAEMVVLSACETGVGRLQRGEGMLSLARAFTYAGAKSLVTSLWKVDDGATTEIMTSFYQQLKTGKTKDEALRAAKLQRTRSNQTLSHPFYWAAFIPTGDMQAIKTKASWPKSWLGLLGSVVLIGSMLWWRRQKRLTT